MYLSKILALFEYDLEKIGIAVSKYSANLNKSSGFSAKNWRGLNPRNPGFLDVYKTVPNA